jgi:hypothetical protein
MMIKWKVTMDWKRKERISEEYYLFCYCPINLYQI